MQSKQQLINHKENLAVAGAGRYLIRVHSNDRSTDGKKPCFLIQVVPASGRGPESEPPSSSTIEESACGRQGNGQACSRPSMRARSFNESIAVIDPAPTRTSRRSGTRRGSGVMARTGRTALSSSSPTFRH